MKHIYTTMILLLLFPLMQVKSQSITPIPNNSFEDWTDFGAYQDPTGWDTPNYEISSIPFFGTTVVSKSTDHQDGNYSVKLETKHISFPALDVPGFITNGDLTVDMVNLTYTVTGGEPVLDQPTHFKGYYKYFPKGGDSCVIAIGLFKRVNDTIRDTIAGGYFSTKDTVAEWSPFSAWIDYDTIIQPDSMNIFALSTAQEVMTVPGTILYIDNLYLDYTVGFNEKDPKAGIDIYNDRETKRLLVFLDFPETQQVSLKLYNMTGQVVSGYETSSIRNGRRIFSYGNLPKGIYILDVMHSGQRYSQKYFLNY